MCEWSLYFHKSSFPPDTLSLEDIPPEDTSERLCPFRSSIFMQTTEKKKRQQLREIWSECPARENRHEVFSGSC